MDQDLGSRAQEEVYKPLGVYNQQVTRTQHLGVEP